MRNIDTLKQLNKDTASQIRLIRSQFKQAQRTGNYSVYIELLYQLSKLQYDYRHHHIAYCELRGKIRSQIENREYNEPNETYIKQIKGKYAWTIEEIETYKERMNVLLIIVCFLISNYGRNKNEKSSVRI